MSTVSNTHLFFLVLASVPFSFSGFMVKQSSGSSGPASAASAVSAAVQADPTTATSTLTLPSTSGASIAGERFTSTVTALLARQTQSHVSVPEQGGEYGNVTIRNNCNITFYLWSVGAWPLNGLRTNDSWNAYQDDLVQIMNPNETHTEPFRITCPPSSNTTAKYCEDYDKLRGQGISIKVSKNTSIADILQLEYALVKNPLHNASYHQLIYDVSLLDCADPGINSTTDATATEADQQQKVNICPGYQGGLSVTFNPDPGENVCKPIRCTGKESAVCLQMYNFDRTRPEEATMVCKEKYEGNMILDLCAGNRLGGG